MARPLLCLFVLFVVAVSAQDHYLYEFPPLEAGSFIQTVYTGVLESKQVVPLPLFRGGWGTSFCELNQNTNVLFCHACHNIENPVSVTISVANKGYNGPEVYTFSAPPSSFFEQAIVLEQREAYPIYSQVNDFLSGRWYITIYSEDEEFHIRGQLEQENNVYSLMTSDNTSPPAAGSPHRGVVVGTYSQNNPQRTGIYDLCHDVVDPTYAVIGRGVPGYPGEFVYDFRNVEIPVMSEFRYTINEEQELLTGYQYAQVRSESNPQGAVRGQLSLIDPMPRLTVTGRMDGNQAGVHDTFARGCILVAYDCNTRKMEFLIHHDAAQPTSLEIRAAPHGNSGNILYSYFSGSHQLGSPIYGSEILNAEQEYILYAQQMYFKLYTVSHPEGEIRGQLTIQSDFFAHLTGVQMVPPVTTAHSGCATFNLIEINYAVNFEIMHSIESATYVNLYRGAIGEPAELPSLHFAAASTFSSADSPLIGTSVLDDDDQVSWIQELSFVQVASPTYPNGEIRGQIMRVAPCDPSPRDSTASPDSLSFGSYDSMIELPITFNSASHVLPSLVAVAFCFLFLF